jgi:hypothetical protein
MSSGSRQHLGRVLAVADEVVLRMHITVVSLHEALVSL